MCTSCLSESFSTSRSELSVTCIRVCARRSKEPSADWLMNVNNNICDMIKGNESDVGKIDFELQAKRGDKFLCFTLFLNLKKCPYLCN